MKQKTLHDDFDAETKITETNSPLLPPQLFSTRLLEINFKELKSHPLWDILVETTHRNPLFSGLLNYVNRKILPQNPHISPRELAARLSISLGEALVLLDELQNTA